MPSKSSQIFLFLKFYVGYVGYLITPLILVAFVVAFVINWFDLGKYYCNFLDKRLEKVKNLATEDFSTPASVRASKASLHYDKYDKESQFMFLHTLARSASNVKSAIAEKAEGLEFTISLKDLRGQIGDQIDKVKDTKIFEFQIPLPGFGRRESIIPEETEDELAKAEQGGEPTAHSTPRTTTHHGSHYTPNALKKIKSNINRYMKNVNIRLKSTENMTPDFLENVSLKFKFNPTDLFKFQGDSVGREEVGPTDAAERLATVTQTTTLPGGRKRPKTLSLGRTRHNSGGSGTIGVTIDVIDDRKSETGSLQLTSSVVVTRARFENFMKNGHNLPKK